MTNDDFNKNIDETVELIIDMLVTKGKEYAPGEDRLHNFNVAAQFKGETMEAALWGMATKHFVSLSDMVKVTNETNNIAYYTDNQWDEKTMDAIIYLFLLRAIRQDNKKEAIVCVPEGNIVFKERG